MIKKCEIPFSSLKREVDFSKFDFNTTKDVQILGSVIGQDRAVRAINFGLAMEDPSYNLFVTGIRGTGRTTIVKDLLNKNASTKETPDDWIYVYNFENPDEPSSIPLPSKRAKMLIRKFTKLITNLKNALTTAFASEHYVEKKNEIIELSQRKKREIFTKIENQARKLNIKIKGSPSGFQTIPLSNNKPMDDTNYQKLTKVQREKVENNVQFVQKKIQEMVYEATSLDRIAEEEVEGLNQNTAKFIVETQFADLVTEFKSSTRIIKYFEDVMEDIVQNVYSFLGTKSSTAEQGKTSEGMDNKKVEKYEINHVVDNSNLKGAPVIYEMNPTYNNLFGRIEKKSYMGYLYTDYTMIKAGSLLKANGGYLILDLEQVLKQSFVYDALKRALRSRCLIIEDINELYGVMTSAGLKPKPIPINIKVVIIGQSEAYHILHSYDEDFRKIFKVRADFDYEVKENKTNLLKYIQFIARVVTEENLLHFEKGAVKSIIEQAYRLVDHQNKLSIRFSEIVKLIRESSYYAKQRKKKIVAAKDVYKAIEEEKYRRNLREEKIQDAISEKVLKFEVDGNKVGQINGLAVYSLGDYSFGKPTRITVSTYIGNKGILNIEREAKLSGKIHDKGVLILSGYFAARFGDSIPLSFSASVTFEQSYGRIDGDSASCAELYILLSSLSQIPIYQGIAVTGSVNQKGEVQAIGGVNEKIEGYFDVCKLNRLNGKQGVIIPESNAKNLILRDDVIESVKNGKFHVWKVGKIEEGIEILTGVPAGKKRKDGSFTKDSVFEGVRQRLIEFSRNSKKFNKQLDKELKNIDSGDTEDNEEEDLGY